MIPHKILRDAWLGDYAAVEAWLHRGGDPNAALPHRSTTSVPRRPPHDDEGQTLLDLVLWWSANAAIIRLLLRFGAHATRSSREFGLTAVHEVARSRLHGRLDVAKLLLDAGAPLDARDCEGAGPLIYAAKYGHCDLLRLFLRRGARLEDTDASGRTAEAWARHCRRRRAAVFLERVREEGGTWRRYCAFPRTRLLALRALCDRGCAEPPPGLLRKLFGDDFPKELLWHVLEFWRSRRAVACRGDRGYYDGMDLWGAYLS